MDNLPIDYENKINMEFNKLLITDEDSLLDNKLMVRILNDKKELDKIKTTLLMIQNMSYDTCFVKQFNVSKLKLDRIKLVNRIVLAKGEVVGRKKRKCWTGMDVEENVKKRRVVFGMDVDIL
jgi:hypothetical protein